MVREGYIFPEDGRGPGRVTYHLDLSSQEHDVLVEALRARKRELESEATKLRFELETLPDTPMAFDGTDVERYELMLTRELDDQERELKKVERLLGRFK